MHRAGSRAALHDPPTLAASLAIRPLRCPRDVHASGPWLRPACAGDLGAPLQRLYLVHSSRNSEENGHRRYRERVAAAALEAQSSEMRLAPSTGTQFPDGIPGPAAT